MLGKFYEGFEKKAVDPAMVVGGAITGLGVGTIATGIKALLAANYIKNHPDSKDAKELIKKYKKHAPEGLEFFTKSDTDKAAKDLPNPDDRMLNEMVSAFLGTGNAAYERGYRLGGRKPQQSIVVGDKVHPSVLAHEIGHALSHAEIDKGKMPKKEVERLMKTIPQEEDAWERAPGPIDEKIKEKALGTYKDWRWILPLSALAGAGVGAFIKKPNVAGSAAKASSRLSRSFESRPPIRGSDSYKSDMESFVDRLKKDLNRT